MVACGINICNFTIILSVLILVGEFATFFTVLANAAPKPIHTIVIDAGHGKVEGRAVSKIYDVDKSHYCTDKPSIIVKCGFLSNSQEEKLLLSKEHR